MAGRLNTEDGYEGAAIEQAPLIPTFGIGHPKGVLWCYARS